MTSAMVMIFEMILI